MLHFKGKAKFKCKQCGHTFETTKSWPAPAKVCTIQGMKEQIELNNCNKQILQI